MCHVWGWWVSHPMNYNWTFPSGIKAALSASEEKLGRVVLLGTPAEEGGGGKVKMIDSGCFNEMDFCMMVHPAPYDDTYPIALARNLVTVTFTGQPAHAAAFPWEGLNALDAAVSTYNTISMLRQQMKPTWRVHGIFTEAGLKPNIIPERAQVQYYVRAPNKTDLDALTAKVHACFEAAAQATGTYMYSVELHFPRSFLFPSHLPSQQITVCCCYKLSCALRNYTLY